MLHGFSFGQGIAQSKPQAWLLAEANAAMYLKE
jgi:hypothetical protein